MPPAIRVPADPDADLRWLLGQAREMAEAAAARAVEDLERPAPQRRFRPDSFEGALALQIARLPAAARTHVRRPGPLGRLAAGATARPAPASQPSFTDIARAFRADPRNRPRIERAQARLIELRRQRHLRLEGADDSQVTVALQLVIHRVECKDDTSERFRDDIWIAAKAQSIYDTTSNAVAEPEKVGKFKTGDVQTYGANDLVLELPVPPGAEVDSSHAAMLFLSEKDLFGFKKYIEEAGNLSSRERRQIVALIAGAAVGALLVLVGVVGGAYLGAVLGAVGGPAGSVIAGTALGGFGLLAGGIAALAVEFLVGAIDLIAGWLRSEMFSPVPVGVLLDELGLIDGKEEGLVHRARFTLERVSTPKGKEGFKPDDAEYLVDYSWRVRRGSRPLTVVPDPPPTEAPNEQAALDNLAKINHVVVLMLENRSFDHMLGYLKLTARRPEVEGTPANKQLFLHNSSGAVTAGPFVPAALLDRGADGVAVPREILDDPRHFSAAVAIQMGTGADPTAQPTMEGFVDDYARRNPASPGQIMGYYTAEALPAYDLIANEFAICNRWFSSFPGNTWVNRVIAVTGAPVGQDGRKLAADGSNGPARITNAIPLHAESFVRTLDNPLVTDPASGATRALDPVSWRWYRQDIPSLLAIDLSYLELASLDNFRGVQRFLDDCEKGDLPAVSWLDPNWIDVGTAWRDLVQKLPEVVRDKLDLDNNFQYFADTANDDHPPGDVSHGQAFVLEVLNALLRSPAWESTMLVVLYDEHGGFYDHVPPPLLSSKGLTPEAPEFSRFGVRVPAMVISPHVGRKLVTNRDFDHCSLIKTILLRFCREAGTGLTPAMTPRVAAADHLGWLLNASTPRVTLRRATKPKRKAMLDTVTAQRAPLRARKDAALRRARSRPPSPPTELQDQIAELHTILETYANTNQIKEPRPRD